MNKMDLSNKAASVRKKFGVDTYAPIDIFALVQNIPGMTMTFFPFGSNISGVCVKHKKSSIIMVNSGMSVGRQRFTLAHELYHYYFDKNTLSTICPTQIDTGDIKEREADHFASYFLIPQTALYELLQCRKQKQKQKITIEDIIFLEQHFKVSRKAMLFRLQEEKELTRTEALAMQKNVISSAARLGYDVSIYRPLDAHNQKQTLGYYVKSAEKLLDNNIISKVRYEEYLLDAYRQDIVYCEEVHEGVDID
ncbi:MAG: ImmA/IrrE family metallo-endopeptidase [Bacteroidales bacterium]|jgi:Zn-dependent peptidase ImmA (M78 family)|nr:ImmA/IrrE family metallo-endopeptidase [Bacteroidales bacterium]